MLRKCGAVVSGSQILQFFERSNYAGSDLDIFLRIGGLHDMGMWLTGQGYTRSLCKTGYQALRQTIQRVSTNIVTSAAGKTVRSVLNYTRFVASTTRVYLQIIQLIVVDMNPIHHVLFDYHSTSVMNYMVYDAIVCVFPRSSILLRKSYVTRNRPEPTTNEDRWRAKYSERGFRIIHKRSRGNHGDLKLGKRSSMDKHSWVIRLEAPSATANDSVYGHQGTDVRFEVMSWRSGATYGDSFARIAEPEIRKHIASKGR
ncbi:hypothetical protein B0H11DRAFT_2256160 [Mycena galericulata]|nr:hypothetical protein B0H11DRAFT_2256160 [Mycena galericulata]